MHEVYTGAASPLSGVSYVCTQENHLSFAGEKKEIHLSNFVFFPPQERSISVLPYCESAMVIQVNKILEKSFGASSLMFNLLFAAESLLAGTEQQGYVLRFQFRFRNWT